MAKEVYIHIPFCEYKCHYCDFNSYVTKGESVQQYLIALDKEIQQTIAQTPTDVIETIFIGGGTPSILKPKELAFLFESILKHFSQLSDSLEFTIEANPGTLDIEKLSVMKEYGINRISMGVQAFQDDLLMYLGRIHSEKDVYKNINNARGLGFENISIDLMFGLPNQTIAMFRESLNKALELDLPHYSLYSLKIEEGTLFSKLYGENKLPLPTDDDDLQMYLLAIETMENYGLMQYEISNFAKKSFESRHNIGYWKNEEYYGFGAGAHGYIRSIRHENIRGIQPYITKILNEHLLPRSLEYSVLNKEKMEDMMFMGLRMLEGVQFADFKNNFQADMKQIFGPQIEKLTKEGLLLADSKGIRLSKKGLIYGNDVFAEFISI